MGWSRFLWGGSRPSARRADVEALSKGLQRIPSLLDRDAPSRGAPSSWSVPQHIDHVLRALRMNLAAVDRLREGGGERGPALKPAGWRVLRRGRIPRGRSAPKAVRPSDHPDPRELNDRCEKLRARLDEIAGDLPALFRVPGRLAHPILGGFGAVEWIRFARIHTDHHLAIVDEILGGPSEARALPSAREG